MKPERFAPDHACAAGERPVVQYGFNEAGAIRSGSPRASEIRSARASCFNEAEAIRSDHAARRVDLLDPDLASMKPERFAPDHQEAGSVLIAKRSSFNESRSDSLRITCRRQATSLGMRTASMKPERFAPDHFDQTIASILDPSASMKPERFAPDHTVVDANGATLTQKLQ
ncbi:MAG TPA: hypothetical protein VGC30_13565 [Dokdonella sp.]